MAAIGGVQGAEDVGFSVFQAYADVALGLISEPGSNITSANLPAGSLDVLKAVNQSSPLQINGKPTLNFRDNIAKGDKSETPLQFTRAPSVDCRVYY